MIEFEQDHDILLVLDQALGLLDHHLGNLDVAARRLVEGRGDDLAVDRALHVGDFLRPLVDQQHDQDDLGIIVGDRAGDVLQEHRLAGPRRRDDQRALALAERRDDVDHPRRLVLDGRVERVELQFLVGVERRQIVEIDSVANLLGIVEVDRRDPGQREIALAFLGPADLALDRVAGAKPEAPDDRRRDVDVVGAGEIIGFGRTEESEAVVQHLDGAGAHDLDPVLGLDFQDREHEVLLAHRRRAFDTHLLGHCDEVRGRLFLQFFQMHDGSFLGELCSSSSTGQVKAEGGRTPRMGTAGGDDARREPS